MYQSILNDLSAVSVSGEIPGDLPTSPVAELILFSVIGICTTCLNDERLRKKQPLERRIRMIMSMLQTGRLSALDVTPCGY